MDQAGTDSKIKQLYKELKEKVDNYDVLKKEREEIEENLEEKKAT